MFAVVSSSILNSFIFSIWEEGGLHGAKNLDYSKIYAEYAFVLDSGGSPGEIIVKAPAQDAIKVKITGKPAHAGLQPEKGISAIMVASRAIENMKLLRIDEETTANIGIVKGGIATNTWVSPPVREEPTRYPYASVMESVL